jgi:multidrug efflux pump
VLGYSVNVLTLFAMVLAIGIVVDDAIVVVENVERIMMTEGLSPREATRKAMDQIIGAIIAITLVLSAVFVPMAFFGGSTGAIYRQFSATLVITILFSALLAQTLAPALCATLLKPGSLHQTHGFIAGFNRLFDRLATRYTSWVGKILGKTLRYLLIYAAIIAATFGLFAKLPGSFLPDEDQGYFLTVFHLPPGATRERATKVLEKIEKFYMDQPEVESMVGVVGLSFFGRGQSTGHAFVMLKDWSQRPGEESSAQAIVRKANMAFSRIKETMSFSINPPSIPEVATVGGFDFRLQDRAGLGREALIAANYQLLDLATRDKRLMGVRPDSQEEAPQLFLDVDRVKAETLGVAIADLNDTMQSALGTAYINDFVRQGRILRVQMQVDDKTSSNLNDILRLTVRNNQGRMVPLGELATPHWILASPKLDRYNGLPSMQFGGSPAPGYSTSDAMAVMEELARKLPAGIGYEWSGISYEERLSSTQAPALFAISLIVVFLCLAALFESWSIPVAVMLVVPLGVFGAAVAVMLRGLPNDVYFKVGLIAIIGLSSKNAILIIEFARKLQDDGMGLLEATIEACRLRLRPILMTSLAFVAGVLPLAISTGAGSASRHAIGTGVIGGMVAATLLAVLLVPVFYVVILRLFPGHARTIRREDNHA